MGLDDDLGGGPAGVGGSFDVDDNDLENELLMLLGDSAPQKGRASTAPAGRGVVKNIKLDDGDLGDQSGDEDDDVDLDDPELHVMK